jgi:hypothetical protein
MDNIGFRMLTEEESIKRLEIDPKLFPQLGLKYITEVQPLKP